MARIAYIADKLWMLEVWFGLVLVDVNKQSGPFYYMTWLVRNQRVTEERELGEHFCFI